VAPSPAALALNDRPQVSVDGSAAPPPALQVCVGCHETGAAPLIPFSSPKLLAQRLRDRAAPRATLQDEIRFRLSPEAGAHRMPLGLNLADAERQALAAYFEALAASAD
jgi:cytochrome c553